MLLISEIKLPEVINGYSILYQHWYIDSGQLSKLVALQFFFHFLHHLRTMGVLDRFSAIMYKDDFYHCLYAFSVHWAPRKRVYTDKKEFASQRVNSFCSEQTSVDESGRTSLIELPFLQVYPVSFRTQYMPTYSLLWICHIFFSFFQFKQKKIYK